MSLLLYINDQLVDLEPGQIIAQTKQVNDIVSIETRQSNYTNKFKVPKTAGNVRIMQFLTISGANSRIPYQKNNCNLYSAAGDCFVNNGTAVITDGGDSYEIVVYDGIVELYKAIENKNLSDLQLGDLDHDKTVNNVIASWNPTSPYRYILADYNGESWYRQSSHQIVFNIDYLVPSINVKYLWDKIFEKFNFSCTGAVFNTQNFKNLWMTFPKGVIPTDEGSIIFETDNVQYFDPPTNPIFDPHWKTMILKFPTNTTFNSTYLYYDPLFRKLKVRESGYYQIELEGNISTDGAVRVFLGKNISSSNPSSIVPFKTLNPLIVSGTDFNLKSSVLTLNAADSISIFMRHGSGLTRAIRLTDNQMWSNFQVRLKKVETNNISFSDALADFSVKDFLSEVIHRFGLTVFRNPAGPGQQSGYTFLTLSEQLQTSSLSDWSEKFVRKISENYTYGNYAQENWFRYNYDNKESNYYDSSINIDNFNLNASRDAIKSKIYAPERNLVSYLRQPGNKYKLWEKEILEDPEEGEPLVTYKPLDKRYYFLRSETRSFYPSIRIGSKKLSASTAISFAPAESFWKLPFNDILTEYYGPMSTILNDTVIINAELFLSDIDIANFDFKKLYYFKQLSAYFLINKINNYISGKPVKCELLKVNLSSETPNQIIRINKVIIAQQDIAIFYTSSVTLSNLALQVFNYSAQVWSNVSNLTNNPFPFNFSAQGNFKIRLFTGNVYSNEVEITIPSSTTILIP